MDDKEFDAFLDKYKEAQQVVGVYPRNETEDMMLRSFAKLIWESGKDFGMTSTCDLF